MTDLEAQLRAYGRLLDRSEVATPDAVDIAPRRPRRVLAVSIAAAVVAAIVVAATIAVTATRSGDGSHPRIATPGPSAPPAGAAATSVLAIGDQVMLGAKERLEAAIPGIVVDAGIGRPASLFASLVSSHFADRPFGAVVVQTGDNGLLTAATLDDIMRVARGRDVFFVTLRLPRAWEEPNNTLLRAVPDRYSNAHVIDWQKFSTTHDDYFLLDGFHLSAAGQLEFSSLIAGEIGPLPLTPVTNAPKVQSVLDIVDVIEPAQLAPVPLTAAGGDVWIASEAHTASSAFVHLERRDPSTAKVVATVDVPQEAVFGIAGDGETLWVAGGGDGGVPQTAVSKVDVPSGRVVFTTTLTGTSCSCPIVAGDAGVWIVGNSSEFALHLSSSDGHVIASVPLGARALSKSAIEIRGRLVVGLENGTIAIVDPATDRIERSIPLPTIADPPAEAVVAMSNAAVPAVGSDPPIDAFAVRARGEVDAFLSGPWTAGEFVSVNDFAPAAVAAAGSRAVVLGSDHLFVATTHAVSSAEFVYDAEHRAFTRATGTDFSSEPGFSAAVAVGDTVWAVYHSGATGTPSIVVVRVPDSVP